LLGEVSGYGGLMSESSPGREAVRPTDWIEWKANSRHVGMPPPKDKALAENVPLLAAYGASTFNRTVSKHGFAKKGRSMVTQDLVDLVGPVYEELYGEGSKGKL
jgi:ATP-dependent NAD(P)H-hydrate dehydratase